MRVGRMQAEALDDLLQVSDVSQHRDLCVLNTERDLERETPDDLLQVSHVSQH